MLENEEELAKLVSSIKEHVDRQFAAGRARVYLSTLGSELAEAKQRSEELSGQRFGEFVQTRLGYEVGRTGTHKNVLFVVPEGASPDAIDDSGPRYNSSFWFAFAKPISEGEKRFINISTLRFGETAEEVGSDPDDVREIDSQFIATEETSRDIVDMLRRIDAWLTKWSLTRDRFLATPRKERAQKNNVLIEIIAMLSHDQLRRTTLPLDVVKSLLS
jgi:hypothetical protein